MYYIPAYFTFLSKLINAVTHIAEEQENIGHLSLLDGQFSIRSAFESSLYFSLRYSKVLFSYSCRQKHPKFRMNPLEASIAEKFSSIFYNQSLYPLLSATSLAYGSSLRPCPPVCFMVIHERFVRYLLPIVEGLKKQGIKYYFLVPPSLLSDITHLLSDLDIPFVDTSSKYTGGSLQSQQTIADKCHTLLNIFSVLYREIKKLKPGVLVVADGNSPHDKLINIVGQALSIPTICIQHGHASILYNGYRNNTYTKFLVWGNWFQHHLQSVNPKQRFIVTGAHSLGEKAISFQDRSAICFFIQAPDLLIDKASCSTMLELARWTATKIPSRQVFIREHPAKPVVGLYNKFRDLPNLQLVPADQVPLAEILSQCRTSISVFSTTIIESLACGVHPIELNVSGYPAYLPGIQLDSPKSLEEAQSSIVNSLIIDDKQARCQNSEINLVARFGGTAINRIIEEILTP